MRQFPRVDVISDTVKKLVDNANLAQDSAQLNVDLANYSLQLSTLTSPITGIVLHQDVNTAGVNITPPLLLLLSPIQLQWYLAPMLDNKK